MTAADFAALAQFSAARGHVASVALAPDRAARVQFEVADAHWCLVVDGGRVTEWDRGRLDDPDVGVRWDAEDARRILNRTLRGDDALRATTVVAAAAGTTYTGTPAPLDLGGRPELELLPAVPGATFGVQYRYRNGPFGDVQYALAFENGRVVDERLGEIEKPDVEVNVTYRAMALVRCGEMSIIEALEGGSVKGDVGPLAALAGISESEEFHAAELATGRHALALAVLGELDADPTFATATQMLVAPLEPA